MWGLALLGGLIGLARYSVAQNEGNDPAPRLELPGVDEGFKFSLLDDAGKLRGKAEYRTGASDKVDFTLRGVDGQFNFANEALSISLRRRLFLDLRSANGELSKHIEVRPDGSTVTNGFTKTSDRLYEVLDNYDGTATINVYSNEQVKYVIKIEPNGGLSVKSNAEPPKETAAIGPPTNE